jgi:hypothetical protein
MRRIAFAALLFLATTTFAQNAPPKLTWIRHYRVESGREAEFLRAVREKTAFLLEPMVASKAIAGWGVAVPVTHDHETWTHIVYVALPAWGNAERVTQALDVPGIAVTHDVVLRHLVQGGDQSAMPQYIGVDTYAIKPGRGSDAVALFNEWPKQTFTSAAVAPKVPVWGLSVQELPSSEPWTHMVWTFMTGLQARDIMDEVNNAIDARKLQGFDVRLRDMSDVEKHRATILKIIKP